nr:hypothetical protein [Bacteroidales bacterium]
MIKGNITEIINNEISNFDFLGNDEFLKEQEIIDLLNNEELQKQFLSDSLLNKNDKIKIVKFIDSNIIGNWDELNTEDANHLSLDYSVDIEYLYDSTKKPLLFNLNFNSDKIDVKDDNSINWNDIDVSILTMNDDDIDFNVFNNAPENIQTLFIQQFIQDFI